MRGRRLRHRIQLLQPAETVNGIGEPVKAWTNWGQSIDGRYSPVTGKEYVKADMVQTEITGIMRIRYLSGVTAAMRAVYDGRTFEIKAVLDPTERKREMQLMVAEMSEGA